MATLTFTFDTGAVPLNRILDAFATAYSYQSIIDGVPNPETKAQFARRMVMEYIRDVVQGQEVNTATKIAKDGVVKLALT